MAAPAKPTITWPDLFALLRDGLARTNDEPFDAWVEREGFEVEAIVGATRFFIENWEKSGERIEALAIYVFTAGWDAHRDLRGER